jgi:predicted AAA+ superfamily ATPase
MVVGLPKYAGQVVRRRGSSPKLQVLNTALMTAQSDYTFEEARSDPEFRGRLVESAVGAHLANAAFTGDFRLYYWRERDREVDFVLEARRNRVAIEVKSGPERDTRPGLDAFVAAFGDSRRLLVGPGGIEVEDFLSTPVSSWAS